MGFLSKMRGSIARVFRSVTNRASSVIRALKKSPSPLSDRLLSDALRIAEIPSPSSHEELRAAFILERLTALDLSPTVDENGNILVRITRREHDDNGPILLFTDLASIRWHPVESLSRLDPDRAYGAGLADAMGPASLLSIAESILSGKMMCDQDLLLLFAAQSLDHPGSDILERLADDPHNRPAAALAVRGLHLGTVSAHPLGTYRIEVRVRTDEPGGHQGQGSAVEAIVELSRTLSGITWDAEKATTCNIRRIEAGTGFGRNPTEGLLDIELESTNGAVLELAMKAAVATAQSKGYGDRTTITIVGYVPVGEPKVGEGLVKLVTQALKEQHIPVIEENSADPASFLSGHDIPAVSVSVASGREGLSQDEIEIASIEKGRKLLITIIERIAAASS